METKKALFLNKYLLTCIKAFDDVWHQKSLEDYKIDGELVYFKVSDFEKHYTDFRQELEVLILETSDITIVYDYLKTCFFGVIYWGGFHSEYNRLIFSIGHDVDFLIKLKQNIEKYYHLIIKLCLPDDSGYPLELTNFFNSIVLKNLSDSMNTAEGDSPLVDECKPDFDIRFDYETMKAECDELKNTQEMILFIHDRINYLKQWQIQYDVYEGNRHKFSTQYYPNFEKLCKIELERLEKKIELEKKLNIAPVKAVESKPTEKEPAGNPYKWNSSNNDLIELVTAMFMVNALKREDGVKITQTELTDFFEGLFNVEIKNDKATRAYISDPLATRPLFIEKLKKGFLQYCESKTDKKVDSIKTRKTGY